MKPASSLASIKIPLDSLNQLSPTTTLPPLSDKQQLQIVLKPQLTYIQNKDHKNANLSTQTNQSLKSYDYSQKEVAVSSEKNHLDLDTSLEKTENSAKNKVDVADKALSLNNKRKLSIILDGRLSDIGVTNLPTFGKCRFKKEANLVSFFSNYLVFTCSLTGKL